MPGTLLKMGDVRPVLLLSAVTDRGVTGWLKSDELRGNTVTLLCKHMLDGCQKVRKVGIAIGVIGYFVN